MKVLFLGHRNPAFPTVTEFMEAAFRSEGHEVTFLEYRDWRLPGRIVNVSGLAASYEGRRLERRLLQTCRSARPDLLFVNYGELLPPEAVREAASLSGAVSVLWLTDFPGNEAYRRRILALAPFFDLVTTQGNDTRDVLRRRLNVEAHLLPAAADPARHRCERAATEHALCFVGSHYPRRQKILEALEGMDLFVQGPGWKRADEWPGAEIRAGGVAAPQACRIYASSEIAVNIHHMGEWGDVRFAQVSPRVFEIAASGAFMLSDRPSDLRLFMGEGEHFVGFDTGEELREAAARWLDDPSGRRKIAERAATHVLAEHTYVHRARQLMDLVEGKDGPTR